MPKQVIDIGSTTYAKIPCTIYSKKANPQVCLHNKKKKNIARACDKQKFRLNLFLINKFLF